TGGTVGGGTLLDANATGIAARNDTGLQGWTVFVDLNKNGQLDTGEPHATTDADGDYVLTVAKPGKYDLREILPPGWTATYPVGGVYKNVLTKNGHLD